MDEPFPGVSSNAVYPPCGPPRTTSPPILFLLTMKPLTVAIIRYCLHVDSQSKEIWKKPGSCVRMPTVPFLQPSAALGPQQPVYATWEVRLTDTEEALGGTVTAWMWLVLELASVSR